MDCLIRYSWCYGKRYKLNFIIFSWAANKYLFIFTDVIDLVINDNDDETIIERELQRQSRPLMLVDYTSSPKELELLREIAFEILRVPSFCVCTFILFLLFTNILCNVLMCTFR